MSNTESILIEGGNLVTSNYVLEPGNCSRYELLYCEYVDCNYGQTMCAITWLCNGSRGGKTLTFVKGDNLWSSYVLEKSGMNAADLAPILYDVKKRFEGSIGEIQGFDEYDKNGLWRG